MFVSRAGFGSRRGGSGSRLTDAASNVVDAKSKLRRGGAEEGGGLICSNLLNESMESELYSGNLRAGTRFSCEDTTSQLAVIFYVYSQQ